jgi:hypothetical protein
MEENNWLDSMLVRLGFVFVFFTKFRLRYEVCSYLPIAVCFLMAPDYYIGLFEEAIYMYCFFQRPDYSSIGTRQ